MKVRGLRYCGCVRRLVGPVALGVALSAAASASAGFQPIERRHGELEVPRVRAGTITVPAALRSGRITEVSLVPETV